MRIFSVSLLGLLIVCGAANALTPALAEAPFRTPISADAHIGNWNNGEMGCASIQRGRNARTIVFRAWNCRESENRSTPIVLEQVGAGHFRSNDLGVVMLSSSVMQVDVGPRSRNLFGNGLYVAPGVVSMYDKQASRTSAPSPALAQPRPLSAGEVVIGGRVGAFQHGTYPSLGDTTHPGVDVVADCGSPVSAWQDGIVIDVVSDMNDRNFNSLGYMVMIDHGTVESLGKRTFSLYLHLEEAPKQDGRSNLEIGTKVTRGSRIGKVGKTGVATGCHLHFETRHFASRFHPDWLNIYGKGDKRRAPEFLIDWTDPKVATLGDDGLSTSSASASASASSLDIGKEVRVWVTAASNVRDSPTTSGSRIINTRGAGALMTGTWVLGEDEKSRWLKVELAAMEIYSPRGPFGYVWDGNLRLATVDDGATTSVREPNTTVTIPLLTAQRPQLRTGAYVSFPTRCAQASNATLEWWNGQFFSGGRKHPAYPRATGPARPNGSQPFVADVKGWEDSKTYRVNFLVLSNSMYERDGLRYFHCEENRLPPTWRGETPSQTAVPSARVEPAMDAGKAPVSPQQFREWRGNGNSYGHLCNVQMPSGSLAVRSTPAGRQVGSIRNGDTFVLLDVRVTPDRETWYRADPLKRGEAGWVSSRFVTCDAMHFD